MCSDKNMDLTSLADDQIRNWPLSNLRELHIEMGKQCNVRCVMCYQPDFSPGTKAAEIVWKERLLPAYEVADTLTLSGGEPTILPGAKELLKLVLNRYTHLKLNTVTNGVLFRGLWDEAFLKHGYTLNVSLNAIDPDLYKTIVQFGRQDQVIENIRRMVRLRNETGSKLLLRISSVIIDQTIHEMPDFVQWAADNGLDEVLLYTDYLRGIRKYDAKAVQEFISATYETADRNPSVRMLHLDDFDWHYARIHNIKPVRPRPISQQDAAPCPIAFDTLFINPDGACKPCCKSWYLYGNLVKSSLPEVWNSNAAFKFRKRMLKLDFRDCLPACDLNAKPIHPHIAEARKAYWVFRREPKTAYKKALRRFGLTSAQLDMPPEHHEQ